MTTRHLYKGGPNFNIQQTIRYIKLYYNLLLMISNTPTIFTIVLWKRHTPRSHWFPNVFRALASLSLHSIQLTHASNRTETATPNPSQHKEVES